MVVHCDGGFWVDEELRRVAGSHIKTNAGITLYRIQPGYFPVVMTPKALLGLQDTLRDLISYVTTFAKVGKGDVMVSEMNLVKRQIYLKPDEPEARDFLRSACEKNLKRAALVPRDGVLQFWVMNCRLLKERMRRLDALCGLRGRHVLELGCAVKHDIVVRELLDVYDVRSYCGLNIEPFEYKPADDNVTLVQQDVLKANFKPNSFDLVFSLAFMEHTPDFAVRVRADQQMAAGRRVSLRDVRNLVVGARASSLLANLPLVRRPRIRPTSICRRKSCAWC